MLNTKDIFSVSLILFSVIDIVGSLPIIITMKKNGLKIKYGQATLIAGILMVAFLFVGENILHLFGVDVSSFAVAGAIVLFLLGLEMIMGIVLFREDPDSTSSSIVPIAFPMIAGAGTLTTILSIKSEYEDMNILVGILVNLAIVFIVLRFSSWIESRIGKSGENILRKIFGIVLIAIAVKLFKTNWGLA